MINTYFFKEQKHYPSQDLEVLFKNKEKLTELKSLEFVKVEGNDFKFEYVGVIVTGDEVLFCYPKYFPEKKEIDDDFKQIIKVIKKFNKEMDNSFYQNDELEDSPFNLLSLMLFFIEDYYENGVYTKTQNILEINGNGEIDWNRTVNETFPIIQDGKPYYTKLQTRYNLNNLVNYFRMLHECIITRCSKYLESYDLLDLFELNSIELSEKSVYGDFGDEEFMKDKLRKELNIEFNTHKRKLLKAMYSFISKDSSTKENILTVYGSNEYYDIWEKMCSEVLVNNLKSNLRVLFSNIINKNYLVDKNLNEVIYSPILYLDGQNKDLGFLKPDLVIFNESTDEFIILDAKYRNLKISDTLELYDVNKQYLYQLSFSKLLEFLGIDVVKNALLFPTYDDEVENRGLIEFQMFSDIGLSNIQLICIPARELTQCYLEGEKRPISWLKLD